MDTQKYRQKHMKHTEEFCRAEARGSPARGWWCHEVALGRDMPGRAWCPWSCFGFQLGWLAVLAGQALAPPTPGTFGISRISHQPSGETVCLITLSKLLVWYRCNVGWGLYMKVCPSVKALFYKQNCFLLMVVILGGMVE